MSILLELDALRREFLEGEGRKGEAQDAFEEALLLKPDDLRAKKGLERLSVDG